MIKKHLREKRFGTPFIYFFVGTEKFNVISLDFKNTRINIGNK